MRRALTGTVLAAVAMATGAAMTVGSAAEAPTVTVTPSSDLEHGQTVRVVAEHLGPEGSGTTAITICGLTDDDGNRLTEPTADDCAGVNDLGTGLVVLVPYSDSIDEDYTLPAADQRFGTNQRRCDAVRTCAIAVADANPDAPAYYVTAELAFAGATPPTTPDTTPDATPDTSPDSSPPTTGPDGGADGAARVRVTAEVHVPAPAGAPAPDPGGSPLPVPVPAPPGPDGGAPALPPEVTGPLGDACATVVDQLVTNGLAPAGQLTLACVALASGDTSTLELLVTNPSLVCGPLAAGIADATGQDAGALRDACLDATDATGALGDLPRPALPLP